MSLEEEFWQGLLEIANREKTTVKEVVEQIDPERTSVNLSSAIRVFVFNYLRRAPEAFTISSIASREVTNAQANEH